VEVLLLHLFGELEVGRSVALLRGAQQAREPLWRQALGRVPGDDRTDAGRCRPGDLDRHLVSAQRSTEMIDEARRGRVRGGWEIFRHGRPYQAPAPKRGPPLDVLESRRHGSAACSVDQGLRRRLRLARTSDSRIPVRACRRPSRRAPAPRNDRRGLAPSLTILTPPVSLPARLIARRSARSLASPLRIRIRPRSNRCCSEIARSSRLGPVSSTPLTRLSPYLSCIFSTIGSPMPVWSMPA
jgi:hypothetical protein